MKTEDILSELNEEQKEAVVYNDGPLLVVAGAGTGKTKVIISKIAYLISEKKAKPSEILAITFTKKAAQEMEERLDIVLPYSFNDVKVCNFHSLAEEFLRENAYTLGFSTNFKILTEPQQILFMRDHIFDFNLKIFRPLSDPTHFIRDLIKHFSRIKDELVSPEEYILFAQNLKNKADSVAENEYADEQMELANAYKQYQELMAMNDRMDFGDLLYKMIGALRKKEQLLANLKNKYKYILVDEFQDTNYSQNELLKILTLNNPTNLSSVALAKEDPIITVVGDDDQSIYKFRGAAISNILDFKEAWSNVKQVVLIKNYRNTQAILDSSYELIQNNNPNRLEAKYKINKKLLAQSIAESKKPELLYYENATEEASGVAEVILSLKAQTPDLKWSDVAILIRSNNQAMAITNALVSKKIPHLFSGNEGLFRKTVIKNIISFLSIVINPEDNFALFNLLTGEVFGLDFDKLSVILHKVRSKNIPLEEYLRNEKTVEVIDKNNFERINNALATITNARTSSVSRPVGEILYNFLTDSGYLKRLADNEKKGNIESGEKIVSIANFFDKITGFQEANLDVGIQKFMEYLNILLEIGEDPKDEMDDPSYDAVKILTVHKSKGLEFRHVFMMGLSDSRFPSRNHGDSLKIPDELMRDFIEDEDKSLAHVQEERRLFYVAMTRAKEGLYFTFGKDYGGKKSVKLSRFVAEVLGQENLSPEYFKQSELERIEHFAPKEKTLYSTRLKIKDEKMRISRAEVDDYLTCPRKYKFIHITPIRMMADQKVSFGRAIHKVIEEYYKAKLALKNQNSNIKNQNDGVPLAQTIGINELLEIYKQNWSSDGFLTQEHEELKFNEGIELVKRFYNDYADKINVAEVERPFKFELKSKSESGSELDPNFNELDTNKDDKFTLVIEGRIDVIENLEGGGIRILDFKTTEIDDQKKADARARDNTQLSVYALAMKEINGELPKEVGLFFLMNGVIGTFVPTESVIEKTKEKIIKAAKGIRAQEFSANPSDINCKYCTFRRYCDDSAV